MIFDFSAQAYAGLWWHYASVHPSAPHGRNSGRACASGQERRRRKLLTRRIARAIIAHGTASGGGADPEEPLPAAPPPTAAGPDPDGQEGADAVDKRTPGGDVDTAQLRAATNVSSLPAATLRGDQAPDTIERAVQAELDGLLELARVADNAPPSIAAAVQRCRKRGRSMGGAPEQPQRPASSFLTLQTKVRAMFEELGDWQRPAPLAVKRKRAKEGKFNTVRLRALQRFILSVGHGGLSLADQQKLFDFLDVWDGTQPGQVKDHGHDKKLRDVFPTLGAFKAALKDDIDAAVRLKRWRKCTLAEGGQTYQAFFTPALHVILDVVKSDENIRLWSGATGPAPPTERREAPFDGDAFRRTEKAVMDEHGPGSCVLGIHMLSDNFQLSWSGGK